MTRLHWIFIFGLAACLWPAARFTPVRFTPAVAAWMPSDIRVIDPVDASQPTLDLLAVYLRPASGGLQLRLDLLDHAALPNYDLYITLDTQPGGATRLPIHAETDFQWDMLLVVPASGGLRVLDTDLEPVRGVSLQVYRDPTLDLVTLVLPTGFSTKALPRVQAFTTAAGSLQASDDSVASVSGLTAVQPASVLLAFSNTYPAYSAVTALRRWSGAHTGPLGGSHGLALLLRAARDQHVPLLLTDLNRPDAWAALETVGGVAFVQQLVNEGLLVLPEALDLPGLEPSKTVGAEITMQPGLQVVFTPPQAAIDGPSLEVRRALAAAAQVANSPGTAGAPLILGGELPQSDWGAAGAAQATLHYLRARPWVRFLGPADLSAGDISRITSPSFIWDAHFSPALTHDETVAIESAIQRAPDNALSTAAGQAYRSLHAPVYPAYERLSQLRAAYSGVVWSLLAAAQWAEHPAAKINCSLDPDRDGAPECVYSNMFIYAQFEIPGGELTHLFSRQSGAVHQIIAPSSQFITGLSEPTGWNTGAGLQADPATFPGAFFETGMHYTPQIEQDRLIFTAENGTSKAFDLNADGFQVEYSAEHSFAFPSIPITLAPDPWLRFSPGWTQAYRWASNENTMTVTPPQAAGYHIHLAANSRLAASTFTDSLQFLTRAENPERDYPPGHFLPFPLFKIDVSTQNQTRVMISITLIEKPTGTP